MGELLIKPYEISVWEDELVTQNGKSFYKENKLAVIGSNTMSGPNKIYEPVFTKNSNGEKTLTFSLKYKYFDPYSGNEEVINPFAALLVNERKVKLKYGLDENGNDQWYDFVIREHSESSDEYTWTYTCTDAFVLELSKNGYNITFSADLNNNQGTARELAKKTLEGTEWRLGNVTVGKQMVEEPVYNAIIQGTITALNTDTNELESVEGNIYIFYSYIKNKNGTFVQFIKQAEAYTTDDKNVIIGTNYRILEEVIIENNVIKRNDNTIITLGTIETRYHAYRLAYNQLTTYDSIMERTVNRYAANDQEVYGYTDYIYTTSNIVMNYITNGENFNVLEDGTLQGWNPYTDTIGNVKKLELLTKPQLGTNIPLADLATLSQIEGFLKVQFNGALVEQNNKLYNTVFNSGIEDNASIIQKISKGQQFLFRWRGGKRNPEIPIYSITEDSVVVDGKIYYARSQAEPYEYTQITNLSGNPHQQNWYEKSDISDIDCLVPFETLGLLVATYTQDDPVRYGYYYKHIKPEDVIMQFEGVPLGELNNYIRGGALIERIDEQTNEGTGIYDYVIDNIVQTPSTKYIYISNNNEYIYNGITGNFEIRTSSNYLPYYYLKTEAVKAVSNTELKDPNKKIGIFIYSTSGADTYYIQDIQLTQYIEDADNHPIIMGNVPVATSTSVSYYYLKPEDKETKDDIYQYTDLQELANDKGIITPEPLYNEGSEKYLSINKSQSNCFDILQTIAETFECWIDIQVEHDIDGSIIIDEDGHPRKFIYLKEYAGKDNYAGFKYGVNLGSIERTVNSEEIVTKLIVNQSQSEYADEGFVSIQNADSNPSGESYILNFDYYYKQGLISNKEECQNDIQNFTSEIKDLNNELKEKEKQRIELEKILIDLESKRNTFTELVETAKENVNEGLADFEDLTGKTYQAYQEEHTTLQSNEQLTEEETILDIIGKLYANSAVINNYSGILTNIEQEYWKIRKQLRGNENFKVSIYVDFDDNRQRHVFIELNDYLPGFSFNLGSYHGESNVSTKYFDILSDEHVITFTTPVGYTVETPELINDNKKVTYKITCNETVYGIEDDIKDIQDQKDELTQLFNQKYRRFIQEGTWNSTDYIDSELYYLDALQVSNTSAQPIVSYTINVVEISQLEGYEWYIFDAGDKSWVEDTEFFGWSEIDGNLTPAREEVIVSEVEWHLDEPDQNTITVQNYKTRFEDLFQRISATVQTVQYNEATYAKISSLLDADGTINQNVLLESLNNISGKNYNLTSDGSVFINGDEIQIRNLTNPANLVKINSEGIRISSDGGSNWVTVINGQGIDIGTVYTGQLKTNQVIIGSDNNPSFRWDKSGISAYKSDNNTGAYDLQTYVRYDEYGLYGIKNNGTFKAQSLNEVIDKAHFAVTWDGFFIKNSYEGGGKVEITSDNDFRVLNTVNNQLNEKIKIGALEWYDTNGQVTTDPTQGVGAPILYGIRIKNDSGQEVMKTDDQGNIAITGTINANAGNIGGMTVDSNQLTMNHIILQPGVGIYSDYSNPTPFIISDTDGTATFNQISARGHIEAQTGTLGQLSVIDTITVGDSNHAGLIKSNGYVAGSSGWAIKSDGTAEFHNAIVRGQIDAGSGNFYGNVTIGQDLSDNTKPYIVIDGVHSLIQSSNYQDGAGYGWMINKDGDAVFNNITARGAIKTAVFEYAEIQAVGGIFIFRPSSTIREAVIAPNGTDLIITVEKPYLFEIGAWCKISNYIDDGADPDVRVNNILLTNGLTHVYRVSAANGKIITLADAASMVDGIDAVVDIDSLIGGALIDMGNKANGDGEVGTKNYGIGVNSSDNTVNLPARAITLFETIIDETRSPKVSYKYRGILGTLPVLQYTGANAQVSNLYHNNLENTQGIYTDNMYIGDNAHYIAFYTDKNDNNTKKLRIAGADIVFTYDDGQGGTTEKTLDDRIEEIEAGTGEDAAVLVIDSSEGNIFRDNQGTTDLTVTIFYGATVITTYAQLTNTFGIGAYLEWEFKDNTSNWVTLLVSDPRISNNGFTLTVNADSVYSKANFRCKLVI